MAKKKGLPKKQKASRSPQGKQRQERRDGRSSQRRQVTGRARLVSPRTVRVPALFVSPHCSCPRTRKPPQAPRSSQEATQPAASEPGPSTPPPAKRSKRTEAEPAAEPTKGTGKGKGKGKAAKAKPAPQPGRWLDRDCIAALNMQRIGESRWRPLELCYWLDQGALPAKGKEYPGLGYKRLQDKPPKPQQQQPAVAQPVNAMVTKKRGVMARCAGAQKAREVMAQRRAAEAEAKAQAGAAEAEAQAQADAGAYEADEAGADEAGAYEADAGAYEAGAYEADAGAYEAEGQAQADARAYEAQLHQLQPELQQREQQVADTQRLQHLQQQLQDLQQDELQRKEQQVAEQQQQLQQQQAVMHLREQQLAEQQHQLQQQQADMQQREQQVAQQHHQVQLQQQLDRLQQQLEAHSGAELQRQVQQQLAAQQHLLQQQQADMLLKQQQVENQPQEAAVQQAVSTHPPLPDHSTCSPQVPGSLRSPLFMRPRQDTTLAPMPSAWGMPGDLWVPYAAGRLTGGAEVWWSHQVFNNTPAATCWMAFVGGLCEHYTPAKERAWQPAAQTSAAAKRVHSAAPTVLLTTSNRFAMLPVADEQEQQLPSQPAKLDEPQGAAASIAAAAVAAVLRAAAESEAAGAAGGGALARGQGGKEARGQGGKGMGILLPATSSPPCTEQPLSPRPDMAGNYREESVFVSADKCDQSAEASTTALVQVIECLLQGRRHPDGIQGEASNTDGVSEGRDDGEGWVGKMDMRQLCLWSDGCASQFKGAKAIKLHWHLANRFGVPVQWSYGATSHFKSTHDSEGGVAKREWREQMLVHPELVGKVCGAAVLTDWANKHFAVPCHAQDTSASHRQRGHIMRRRYLVLDDARQAGVCSMPEADVERMHDKVEGCRAMHRMVFTPDREQPQWAMAACACSTCMSVPCLPCMKPDTTTPLEPMPMFQDTVKEVYDDEESYALLMWFHPDLLHDEVCFGKLTNTHCARYCQHMGLDRPKERRKLRRLVVRELRSEQLEFEYEVNRLYG
ncbi:hypothetical protein QJQ45_000203 [Haematococcus lacustris]|nr:hypothetical protein QJQ45_000203 [Haematococcus lacustris]